jgi:translation initiation factor 4E|mmetsp:Transcript_78680/g.122804  ORF Transcript_78680/g.122804 Transcript_78680/m.122804 type:complete len:352 (+) Transcript_78680:70-1125(+)
MATLGIRVEELQVREGEFPSVETPLETAWTFWYDKKTSDKKESDQYMEGLKQLGSFNTVEGFYRHYTWLMRPTELPRDHNILLFRRGYKPMWEEFPEGGCWIIRIKRKVAQNYVNRMWENLLIACIGEAFEMPDVVGCVLSTRLKDDVLSVWNLSNRNTEARFRIGEKLKEVLDLDMNALIQYKDHMQSLQDYSTFRNAKNYMFAPSPNQTPQMGTLETPLQQPGDPEDDFEEMLPAAAIDTMLPPAAIDTDGFFSDAAQMKSPPLSADAPPFSPPTVLLNDAPMTASPQLSPEAPPWYPPGTSAPGPKEATVETNSASTGGEESSKKSWAAIAASAPKSGSTSPKGKGAK